jgi:calcineurin-like phosphoesterase family protein
MTKWFTSDNHFFHKNIIEYCERPFFYVQEMNRVMIERWNERVQPNDTVYHLGDFAFGSRDKIQSSLKKLNGHIILVRGNHDKGVQAMLESGFPEVYDKGTTIKLGKRDVNLHHFPYLNQGNTAPEYELKYASKRPHDDGKWLICGHIHEKWKVNKRMVNVGVDVWDFYPVNEQTLIELMDEYDRVYKKLDIYPD